MSGANTLFTFVGEAVLALNTSNGVAPQTLSGLSVLTLGGGAIAVNAAVSASSGAVRLGTVAQSLTGTGSLALFDLTTNASSSRLI